ncbi:LuxR family transcriptional regulator [Sphingobium sp. Leaf26]|nr:LuxR family transcriptional regulator [Sphingobium sp. Leaf26]
MSMQMTDMGWTLTEKEKQTLRLIVRGHDAKSIARSLGLSVHTINERLRDARRKMAVSSSREAARLLLEAEGGDGQGAAFPNCVGDTEIGEDAAATPADQDAAPTGGAGRAVRPVRIIIGVTLMTFLLGLLALAAIPQNMPTDQTAPVAASAATDPQVVDAARQWLTLVDQGKWEDSYRGTMASFRKLNSLKVWADTSEKVRVPLGAVLSRVLLSQQNLPAPPYGYEVVKFRTSYANKADAIETVSLDKEGGIWRVAGVTIE